MTVLADPLPDDRGTLKAMLIAERARTERLTQIIKELQRHRFGRRAESLPIDQLELGLEDVQQVEAESEAKAEAADPDRRATGRQAPHQPRIAAGASAPDRGDRRRRGQDLPRAARARCTGSARTSPNGWTSSQPSSGCWWCAGRSTPAAPARKWWSRRRRRRG